VQEFKKKVDKVEAVVASAFRDRLGAATSAAEMLRVFSVFNALLIRPQVREVLSALTLTD
jgi:hypothetical protein